MFIWTPDHPDFYAVLHGSVPPGQIAEYYCVSSETGLLVPSTEEQAEKYVFGGEMEEALGNDADCEGWQIRI